MEGLCNAGYHEHEIREHCEKKITFLILFGLDWMRFDNTADRYYIGGIQETTTTKENNMTNQEIANKIISRNIQSAFVETLIVLALNLPTDNQEKVIEILDNRRK